jgi:hypothetical protein
MKLAYINSCRKAEREYIKEELNRVNSKLKAQRKSSCK